MDILVVAPQPFFVERGTPIAVRLLVETLCANGHRVDLLTYPFGEDPALRGLTIHRCSRFPGVRRVGIGFSVGKLLMDVMLTLALFRLGKASRYDVVHAVEESIYPALLLRRRHRARVIYDMDSALAEQLADSHVVFRSIGALLRRLERRAIRRCDLVVPMCEDLAYYANQVRDSHDTVVLHDVPLDTGSSSECGENLARHRAAGGCLALYVGNLSEYQGIDLLVEAAALLPASCPVSILVIGGPISKVEQYRALASQRGVDERIHFLGPRPLTQLKSLLVQADILVSPRTSGGNTPMKLYSYMDAGRAILATRLSTHTQVLDESTAILAEPQARDFARGLLLLARDAELRHRLGKAAKDRVAANYSIATFRAKVRKMYRALQEAPPTQTDATA